MAEGMILYSFLDSLQQIIDGIVGWIESGAIFVVNLVITGLGVIITAGVSALPGMPSVPTMPQWILVGTLWTSYWFPLPFLFDTITTVATLWISWLIIRIPLRWGKANSE